MNKRCVNSNRRQTIGIGASLRILLIMCLTVMGVAVFRGSGDETAEVLELIRTDGLFLAVTGCDGYVQLEGARINAKPVTLDWSLKTPLLGIIGCRSISSAGWGRFALFVPRSIAAGLLLAYPTVAFIRGPLRRRRRRKRGLCVACGYNLAGLTERRCPECNTRFGPTEEEQSE